MPTTNTDVYAGQTSTIHAALPTGTQIGGSIRFVRAIYSCTGTEVATDTINVCQIPIGARVMTGMSSISSEACGGTAGTILKLGHNTDDDAYSTSVITVSTANAAFTNPVAATEAAQTAATATTNTVIATIGGLTGGTFFTKDKKIIFLIAYLLP